MLHTRHQRIRLLICSSSKTTSGMPTAIIVTTWLSLRCPARPIFLFHSQISELSGDGVGLTIQVLDSGTHLYNPSRKMKLLLLYQFSR